MTILELENRCTGNRTEGSNPSLSAIKVHQTNPVPTDVPTTVLGKGVFDD